LRTRFILDEDVNARAAVKDQGSTHSAEGTDGDTLMETDEHAAVIRRLYGAFFSEGRVALAEELHGPGFVYHDVTHPDQVVDLDGYLKRNAGFAAAFPDRQVRLDDVVAAGDRVVARATMHATHTGDLFGIGATGKKVRLASIIIYRFAGGKIVEEWEIFDVLGLYQQLGLAPPPA
jgi:steroid delta-isomerase-like uncharacterized protein